jgi:hypothetical protein
MPALQRCAGIAQRNSADASQLNVSVHFSRNGRTCGGQGHETVPGIVRSLTPRGRRVNTQQVGRAGEMFVAAEIHRRGGYAAIFAGNMSGIDILAINSQTADGSRFRSRRRAAAHGTPAIRKTQPSAARMLPAPHSGSSWTWAASILLTSLPPGGGYVMTSGRSTLGTSPGTSRSTVTRARAVEG